MQTSCNLKGLGWRRDLQKRSVSMNSSEKSTSTLVCWHRSPDVFFPPPFLFLSFGLPSFPFPSFLSLYAPLSVSSLHSASLRRPLNVISTSRNDFRWMPGKGGAKSWFLERFSARGPLRRIHRSCWATLCSQKYEFFSMRTVLDCFVVFTVIIMLDKVIRFPICGFILIRYRNKCFFVLSSRVVPLTKTCVLSVVCTIKYRCALRLKIQKVSRIKKKLVETFKRQKQSESIIDSPRALFCCWV